MPTRRDNDAERTARIEWLLEENRTKVEATATEISKVLDHVERASKIARANLNALRRRPRASKA